MKNPNSSHAPTGSFPDRYGAVRRQTQALTAPLTPEDCTVQSMTDASPAKWHLAHTSWFFETFILKRWQTNFRPFHPSFEHLFNSYYNSVGNPYPRPHRGMLTRPDLGQVLSYRDHVDQALLALLGDDEPPPEILSVLEVGLHHEQQHQELLLMDIKHLLSLNPIHPTYRPDEQFAHPAQVEMAFAPFDGGLVEVGLDPNSGGFGYDNEAPRHRVWLEPFELATRLVTCGEYLAFIEDGGYQRPELWLSDGWATRSQDGAGAPLYWDRSTAQPTLFTLGGPKDLNPHQPVAHMSFYEANAYARWAGARLPSEFEWELAAREAEPRGNFSESGRLEPIAGPTSPERPVQLFGDLWEWTASDYAPYPGFRAPAGALGEYNGKFMCNQKVLRGGSCATPQSHIRATYRNFFYPHQRWMFSGIRLARDPS